MKLLLPVVFLAISLTGFTAPKTNLPNIIVIYIDDMGIGDLTCFNGEVMETPNIDALAKRGKIFTQYYSDAPVCSPSRVALTTGMNHIRWGINTFLSSRKFNAECQQVDYLKSTAPSMARTLKEAGYHTAHFGKWHMGGGRDVKDAPEISAYGFDEFASTWESPNPDPLLTSSNWIWASTDSIKRWERTAYFIDRTLDFLERNSNAPCFIKLWPDDVHSPWIPSEQAQLNWKENAFKLPFLQPVIKELDIQIGRFINELENRNLLENTLIVFTSDNGPAPSFDRIRTNGMRGLKNSLYEGGIRMPMFAVWPKEIKPGQIDSSSVLCAIDLFPTISAIAGTSYKGNYQQDGEDFSQTLLGQKPYEREQSLRWEYGRNERYNYPEDEDRSPQLAIRNGQWKLLTDTLGTRVELYNLVADPTESVNKADEYIELTTELKTQLLDWYKDSDKSAIK